MELDEDYRQHLIDEFEMMINRYGIYNLAYVGFKLDTKKAEEIKEKASINIVKNFLNEIISRLSSEEYNGLSKIHLDMRKAEQALHDALIDNFLTLIKPLKHYCVKHGLYEMASHFRDKEIKVTHLKTYEDCVHWVEDIKKLIGEDEKLMAVFDSQEPFSLLTSFRENKPPYFHIEWVVKNILREENDIELKNSNE